MRRLIVATKNDLLYINRRITKMNKRITAVRDAFHEDLYYRKNTVKKRGGYSDWLKQRNKFSKYIQRMDRDYGFLNKARIAENKGKGGPKRYLLKLTQGEALKLLRMAKTKQYAHKVRKLRVA